MAGSLLIGATAVRGMTRVTSMAQSVTEPLCVAVAGGEVESEQNGFRHGIGRFTLRRPWRRALAIEAGGMSTRGLAFRRDATARCHR
jgi:hypothetical protein